MAGAPNDKGKELKAADTARGSPSAKACLR
jgi:hypothetical protein